MNSSYFFKGCIVGCIFMGILSVSINNHFNDVKAESTKSKSRKSKSIKSIKNDSIPNLIKSMSLKVNDVLSIQHHKYYNKYYYYKCHNDSVMFVDDYFKMNGMTKILIKDIKKIKNMTIEDSLLNKEYNECINGGW